MDREVLHDCMNLLQKHLSRIETARDKNTIERSIHGLEEVDWRMHEQVGGDFTDVRSLIRNGVGVFSNVKDKCIQFGCV